MDVSQLIQHSAQKFTVQAAPTVDEENDFEIFFELIAADNPIYKKSHFTIGKETARSPVAESPQSSTCANESFYRCSKCAYTTPNYISFRRHNYSAHAGKYRCQLCNYSNDDKFNLKRHFRCHEIDSTYSCSFCSFSASQISALKTHERLLHTAAVPVKKELEAALPQVFLPAKINLYFKVIYNILGAE